jgi:hypothetical protein
MSFAECAHGRHYRLYRYPFAVKIPAGPFSKNIDVSANYDSTYVNPPELDLAFADSEVLNRIRPLHF